MALCGHLFDQGHFGENRSEQRSGDLAPGILWIKPYLELFFMDFL
jgi:hypothetical protein